MRRPARVATISKACTPCPVSTNASTRSPFMEPTILPRVPIPAKSIDTFLGRGRQDGRERGPLATFCWAGRHRRVNDGGGRTYAV
jgi:hypothetical protein